jgi:hypothetical protein
MIAEMADTTLSFHMHCRMILALTDHFALPRRLSLHNDRRFACVPREERTKIPPPPPPRRPRGGPRRRFFQFHDRFTEGRTSWTSDQLVARPLPKHRTTQTQNKHIYIPNVHALCVIRTHDSGFRASEISTFLRPLSYRDRHKEILRASRRVT